MWEDKRVLLNICNNDFPSLQRNYTSEMSPRCISVILLLTVSCCSVLSASLKQTAEVWDALSADNKTNLITLLHHGNKSYYLGTEIKVTYFQAMQICESIHMKLVSVESSDENYRLYNYLRNANQYDNIWTSGAKLLDGKHWIWMSKGQLVQYTNWGSTEPSSANEYCIEMLHTKNVNLFWNDRDCFTTNYFICEREKSENTPEGSTQGDSLSNYESPYISPSIPLLHFEDKSYYVGNNIKATFQEAMQICEMMNMQLVTITSEEQNNIIYKYLRDTVAGADFWTSGTKMVGGKTWIWITSAQIVEYTNWNDGQPDTPDHQCISLNLVRDKGLYWNDVDCTERYFFVCEKPRGHNFLELRTPPVSAEYRSKRRQINNINTHVSSTIEVIHMSDRTFHLGINFKATYAQALRYCQRHYMKLVSIPSYEDNEILRNLLLENTIGRYSFWTSGKKLDSQDTWRWSSEELVTYFNWKSAESQNVMNNTFCIQINNDETGSWNAEYCEKESYFICEEITKATEYPNWQSFIRLPVSDSPLANEAIITDGDHDVVTDNITKHAGFRLISHF